MRSEGFCPLKYERSARATREPTRATTNEPPSDRLAVRSPQVILVLPERLQRENTAFDAICALRQYANPTPSNAGASGSHIGPSDGSRCASTNSGTMNERRSQCRGRRFRTTATVVQCVRSIGRDCCGVHSVAAPGFAAHGRPRHTTDQTSTGSKRMRPSARRAKYASIWLMPVTRWAKAAARTRSARWTSSRRRSSRSRREA